MSEYKHRVHCVRFNIADRLKTALRSAKKGCTYSANYNLNQLQGMLFYMLAVNDITIETYDRVDNLINLIQKKYRL